MSSTKNDNEKPPKEIPIVDTRRTIQESTNPPKTN